MKVKILSALLAMSLLLSCLGSGIVFASVSYEDFDTYSESDGGDCLSTDGVKADFTAMNRGDSSWLYYDFGASYFSGNMTVMFELYVDELTANTLCQGHIFGVTSALGDGADLAGANKCINIQLRYSASGPTLSIEENIGYSGGSTPLIITQDTLYYITFKRVDMMAYMYVYSDEDRLNLVGSKNDNLTTMPAYRYIQPIFSHGFSGAYPMTGYVQNMQILNYGSPTCTTGEASNILYDEWGGWFDASMTGNLADDGGTDCEVGFFYKKNVDSEWSWVGDTTTYNTGENFTLDITTLEAETMYDYKAYAYNDAGYDEGSTANFTTSYQTQAPIIQTLAYPINYYTDNVTVYGYISYDGSANVTGDFQYKLGSSATWLWSSSNTTDLQTSDQYSYNISPVTENVTYDYRAVGTNVYGITYGDTGHFILYNSVAPTMETLTHGTLTANTAWISGNVTDDGGEPVFANFKWRKLGVDDWNDTSYTLLETGEDYSYKLTGLNPSTTYQYRAYGWHGIGGAKTEGYGDIHTFYTYDAINIPIMETGDWNYLNEFYASVDLICEYDGGSSVLASLQYRLSGDTVWTETTPTSGLTTGYEVSHMTYELMYGSIYEYRAKGENEQGIGYGLIEIETFIAPDDTVTTDIPIFVDIFTDVRNSLGLTGEMGTWAFMALILLLVAIVFGSAMFTQKDNDTAKAILGVIWALISMAVVGAFIFTGQLGIWPIVILVGGVVVVVMVIVGSKLSGGQA